MRVKSEDFHFAVQTPPEIMIQLMILHTTWFGALMVQSQPLKAYLHRMTLAKGRMYDDLDSQQHIEQFIADYNVDVLEVAKPLAEYRTLNEFFYRKHRPGARPVHEQRCAAVLRCCTACCTDGDLHVACPAVHKASSNVLRAIGRLNRLLAVQEHSSSCAAVRLSPDGLRQSHACPASLDQGPQLLTAEAAGAIVRPQLAWL
jgi:phosphatidylserine decarboxylase